MTDPIRQRAGIALTTDRFSTGNIPRAIGRILCHGLWWLGNVPSLFPVPEQHVKKILAADQGRATVTEECSDLPDPTPSVHHARAGSVVSLMHDLGADLLLSGIVNASLEAELRHAAALIAEHVDCEPVADVLVDVSDVTFADTTLLGVLIAVHRSVTPESTLIINNPSPLIGRMLATLGFPYVAMWSDLR